MHGTEGELGWVGRLGWLGLLGGQPRRSASPTRASQSAKIPSEAGLAPEVEHAGPLWLTSELSCRLTSRIGPAEKALALLADNLVRLAPARYWPWA